MPQPRPTPLLVLLSLCVTACVEADDDGLGGGGGLFSCDGFQLFPGDCVDSNQPFAFTTDVDGLATGATATVYTLVHESIDGFRVETSDPEVVGVAVSGESVILTALAEGTARITAHPELGSRTYDVLDVTVEPIASVDFIYIQRGDEPLTQLAGLAGSSEAIHVVYRGADDAVLLADGVVDVVAEGELSLGGAREPRMSDLVRGLAGGLPGDAHTVTFGQPGAGLLHVQGGGVDTSLFVRVVDRADELLIEAGDGELAIGAPELVFLHADMATGEPVAGVRGVWTIEPADAATLTLQVDPASEALLEATATGPVRVTVAVDGKTVTRDFDAQ